MSNALINAAFALTPHVVDPARSMRHASWSTLGLQVAWVVLAQSLAVLACIAFSSPYASAGARSRGAASARKRRLPPATARAGGEGVELTDFGGRATRGDALHRALAFVPLDKLADALSPDQLAKRLRTEVESLVGTEARRRFFSR